MHSQLSLDAYGVTYAHLQDGSLQFESEAALQLDDDTNTYDRTHTFPFTYHSLNPYYE